MPLLPSQVWSFVFIPEVGGPSDFFLPVWTVEESVANSSGLCITGCFLEEVFITQARPLLAHEALAVSFFSLCPFSHVHNSYMDTISHALRGTCIHSRVHTYRVHGLACDTQPHMHMCTHDTCACSHVCTHDIYTGGLPSSLDHQGYHPDYLPGLGQGLIRPRQGKRQ